MDTWVEIIKMSGPIIVGSIIGILGPIIKNKFDTKQEEEKNKNIQRHVALKIRHILTAHSNFLQSEHLTSWIKEKSEVQDPDLLLECKYFVDEIKELNLDQSPFIFEDLDPNITDKFQHSIRVFHSLLGEIFSYPDLIGKADAYYSGDCGDEYEFRLENIRSNIDILYKKAIKANEEAQSLYLAYFKKKYPNIRSLT